MLNPFYVGTLSDKAILLTIILGGHFFTGSLESV